MKILKNFTLFAFALMMVAGSLTSCKKGEQDPGISFKSRAARMDGNYTVTSGNSTGEYKVINNIMAPCIETTTGTISSNYDGKTEISKISEQIKRTSDCVENDTTLNYADTTYQEMAITFTKDGSYTWTVTTIYDPLKPSVKEEREEQGTWNFTGKIGDVKNKEQIVLNPVTIKTSDYASDGTVTTTTVIDQTENAKIYSIIGLRSDEIILSQFQKYENANGESTGSITTEYTLTEGGE